MESLATYRRAFEPSPDALIVTDADGMVVDDDGRGFDAVRADGSGAGRLGLVGARERIALIGGTLAVESARGRLTSVLVRAPLPAEGGAGSAPPEDEP